MRCDGTTKAGGLCRALALKGQARCGRHTTDPTTQAAVREAARKGGRVRAGQMNRPTADPLSPLEVADLNLETVAGLKTYLARALRKLAELPFDVRVANSIAQLVNSQRGALEASDLEERIARLETQLERGARR